MIKVSINTNGVVSFLASVDSELEDEIDEAVEKTINEVEEIARDVIENEYTFDIAHFPIYYDGNNKKTINGSEGSVEIQNDFIPIHEFYYYNWGFDGHIGEQTRTITHDAVEMRFHKGVQQWFKSYNFLHNSFAFRRLSNSSTPYKSFYAPTIPQMLSDEIDIFAEEIEKAFQRNIEEAIGEVL